MRKGKAKNFSVLNPDEILCKLLLHIYILCAPVELSCYTGTLFYFLCGIFIVG